MTSSIDPASLSILQSINQLIESVGSSIASSQQQRLAEQAIQRYLADPSSISNLVSASRFIDLDKAIKAAQEQSVTSGLDQLASTLGISPDVARLLYNKPEILGVLSQAAKPQNLPHLSDLDLKKFYSLQDDLNKDLERANLARQVRLSGNQAALVEYANRTGLPISNFKKLKNQNDIREFGRKSEINDLVQSARKQVELNLLQRPNLSTQQVISLRDAILSSPIFAQFLESEVDNIAQTTGIYSPNLLANRVGKFVDRVFDQQAALLEQPLPSNQPMMGRIQMPPFSQQPNEQVAIAQNSLAEQTPSGDILVQDTVVEAAPTPQPQTTLDLIQQSLKPTEKPEEDPLPPPVSFKGKPSSFFSRARAHDTYKDWSDQELQDAYDNHKKLSQGRSLLSRVSLHAEPPSKDELKQILSYALNEDLFYQGIKPNAAQNITQMTLDALGDDFTNNLLSNIRSKQDLSQAVDFLMSKQAKQAFKQLPEETSVEFNKVLTDTLAVGGTKAAFAALDQLPLTLSTIAAVSQIPAAGIPLAIGSTALNVLGAGYRFWENNKKDAFYNAFFQTPTSASQKQRFYEQRYKFIDRYKDSFSSDEKKNILKGSYDSELSTKILEKLQEQGFFLDALDLLFRPVSKLDDATFHLMDRVENTFPNANPSSVLALELFGGLSGGKATYSLANRKPSVSQVTKSKGKYEWVPPEKVTLITPSGDEIKVSPITKESLNSTRKALVKSFKPKGSSDSESQKIYNEYWNNWAKSLGKEPFQPFIQENSTWLSARPYLSFGGVSLAYGLTDYYLNEAFEEPYFFRLLANVAANAGGHSLNLHFYRMKNQAHERNTFGKREMFRQFTEDFNGTTNTKGNSTVFDIPLVKKQITLSPEGMVSSKESPNPISNIPQGFVNLKEYSDVQSPNFISFYGLSKDLDIDLPDFTRTPPSKGVSVDTHAVQRFVEDSWKTKKDVIEKARQEDLKPFIDPAIASTILGDSKYKTKVPETNDIKAIASALYDQIPEAAQGPLPQESLATLQNGISKIVDYFSQHPTLGPFSKERNLLVDVAKGSLQPHSTVEDLVAYHQKINNTKYDLQKALRKEYSIDNQILYDFYTALNHWVVQAFPPLSREILRLADNAYFAYKYSESIDDFLKSQRDIQFNEWFSKKNVFKKDAKALFETFGDSHVSNAVRKALVHDDYLRHHLRAPNVGLSTEGKIVRPSHAVEATHELKDVASAVRESTFLTALGAPIRLLSNIFSHIKDLGAYDLQKMGAKAMKSTPFYLADVLQPLVDASKQAHNLRLIRSPSDRRISESPKIVSEIEAFAKQQANRVSETQKAQEQSFQEDLKRRKKALDKELRETKKAAEKEIKKTTSDVKKELQKAKDFALKQQKVKEKYKQLAKARRDLARQIVSSRNTSKPSHLKSLIDKLIRLHERIGNLRSFITEGNIKEFDLEQSSFDDFIKNLP